MTYEAREESVADGRPVELYTFQRGALTWRYTSADRDVVVETNTYRAVVIKRPQIGQGQEIARSVLSLDVPRTLDVLDQYRIVSPSDEVTLVLRSYHVGDVEVATIWQGVVLGVKFDMDSATLHVEPRSSGLRRLGLRRIYQRQCPHLLYGAGCNVSAPAFMVTGPVATVNTVSLEVPAADVLPDGHFDGGYVEWLVAVGTYERRSIAAHVGALLYLDVQSVGLTAGMQVRMFPGCDRSAATCNTKFANILNYGGMPYIPLKNPFGSDPVY